MLKFAGRTFLICFILCTYQLFAFQSDTNNIKINLPIPPLDSIVQNIQKDTSSIKRDSLKIKKKGSIDSLVTGKARDSITFNVKSQIIKLYGDAKLTYKTQILTADYVEMSMKDATLLAEPTIDSNGKVKNFPVFNDKGEEYYGKVIRYNFKTQKGTIELGETQLSEGFYFGKQVKRVSDKELNVKDGFYTTCDAPQPHYYFGSPKMKIVLGDKVYVDPLIFYVEEMPIFLIPFGFYIPNKTGRQSGLMVPTFFFSNSRGVVLEKLGYYFAPSEYWDTQLSADYFTKGGYMLHNKTVVKIGDALNTNIELDYGKTREKYDMPFSTNWRIDGTYNQIFTPMENISGNFSFASQDFNRNTLTNLSSRVVQDLRSNIGYNRTFENGTSLSLAYSRNQNIITNDYTQNVPISYSIPIIYPLRGLSFIPRDSWMRDISFNLRTNGSYTQNFQHNYLANKIDSTKIDTTIQITENKYIEYRPSINISPKFSYFTFNPNISFSANNFFRRLTREMNPLDSTFSDRYENGLFWEYWYSIGIGVSTRLYGIWDARNKLFGFISPKIFGISAFRHTYSPNFSFSFTPDFSKQNYNLYGTYYDYSLNKYTKYSRFINEGSSHAPQGLSQTLSYSDNHTFSIKLPSKDTLPEKKLDLLTLNFSTGYNFAADSMNLSDLSLSFRSPLLDFINFSGNSYFTFYDEANIYDSNGAYRGTNRINKFLISQGKGLARLTSINLSFSTSFSSQGISLGPSMAQNVAVKQDTIPPGERFMQKLNVEEEEFDYFGEHTPGYMPILMPWSVTINGNFGYSQYSLHNITRSLDLNLSLNLTITKSTRLSATTQYDVINKELLAPQITITKDLHCWELYFSWIPSGINNGFYLRFNIKSPQLRDLKLERRSNPLYR